MTTTDPIERIREAMKYPDTSTMAWRDALAALEELREERDVARRSVDELQDELVLLGEELRGLREERERLLEIIAGLGADPKTGKFIITEERDRLLAENEDLRLNAQMALDAADEARRSFTEEEREA